MRRAAPPGLCYFGDPAPPPTAGHERRGGTATGGRAGRRRGAPPGRAPGRRPRTTLARLPCRLRTAAPAQTAPH